MKLPKPKLLKGKVKHHGKTPRVPKPKAKKQPKTEGKDPSRSYGPLY